MYTGIRMYRYMYMYIYVYSIHLSSSSLAQGPRFTTFGRSLDELWMKCQKIERKFDENSTNFDELMTVEVPMKILITQAQGVTPPRRRKLATKQAQITSTQMPSSESWMSWLD